MQAEAAAAGSLQSLDLCHIHEDLELDKHLLSLRLKTL